MTAVAPSTGHLERAGLLAGVVDARGSVRPMALLRLVLGPAVVLHLWPHARRILDGTTFADTFHVPWWGIVPDIPGGVQVALVGAGLVAGVLLGVGAATRWASAVAFVAVTGNLFLSQHHYGQNRAYLVYLLGAVALSDAGRVLSVDAWRARRRGRSPDDEGWLWPLLTMRFLASSVYVSSGLSKLLDPDWVGGLVLWDRSVRYQGQVRDHDLLGDIGLADPIADLVVQRWVHAVASPVIVATELVIGIGLWFGRSRLVAAWLAVAFHVSIEVSAQVEVFSIVGIAALALWATPSTRDRVVVADPADPLLGWVRRLDWLARFRIEERPGATLTVVDRDGSVRAGVDARRLVDSRLPLTFVVLGPVLAVRAWRSGRTAP